MARKRTVCTRSSSSFNLSLDFAVPSQRLRKTLSLPTRSQSAQHKQRETGLYVRIYSKSPIKSSKAKCLHTTSDEQCRKVKNTLFLQRKPLCHPPAYKTNSLNNVKLSKSHLRTSSCPWKQNQSLTWIVCLTSLTISGSILPTAADGSSALFLLTVETEQIKSDESVR